eukprot:5301849-Pyramimonas_sp.AAC.1
MCEVAQLYPTYRVKQDEEIISAGRLDRVYASLDSGHLLDLKPAAGVIWPVTDLSKPSDHTPVYVSVFLGPRNDFPRILSWVTGKHQFSEAVVDLWEDMPSFSSAFTYSAS